MCLFPPLDMVGKRLHISQYIVPSFVVLGSTVVKNTTFVLLFSSRSISGGFSLIYCIPCLLMYRYPIFLSLDFSICLLISFSVRPGHIFKKSYFISLGRFYVVGLKSVACRYCDSSRLYGCTRMLFVASSYSCVFRGNYHIPYLLFLVYLFIYCCLFWNDISCLSSVMVNPSSHKTPNYISGDVLIIGKRFICLTLLLRSDSWSVAMDEDSIVLPFARPSIILFDVIIGSIVVVACFYKCTLTSDSDIAKIKVGY